MTFTENQSVRAAACPCSVQDSSQLGSELMDRLQLACRGGLLRDESSMAHDLASLNICMAGESDVWDCLSCQGGEAKAVSLTQCDEGEHLRQIVSLIVLTEAIHVICTMVSICSLLSEVFTFIPGSRRRRACAVSPLATPGLVLLQARLLYPHLSCDRICPGPRSLFLQTSIRILYRGT